MKHKAEGTVSGDAEATLLEPPPLRKQLLALSLRSKLRLPWRLLKDPEVPLPAKLLIPLGASYLAMPFDIIPDFIPVLGQLDDLLLLFLGLGLFLRLCPEPVLRRHVEALRAEE